MDTGDNNLSQIRSSRHAPLPCRCKCRKLQRIKLEAQIDVAEAEKRENSFAREIVIEIGNHQFRHRLARSAVRFVKQSPPVALESSTKLMSRDRSDRYGYSAPETGITLGSDRVATPVIRNLEEDVNKKYGAKKDQRSKIVSKEENAVRESKETSSTKETLVELKETVPETLEQRLDRTEDVEAGKRIPRRNSLDYARWMLTRHCFSTSSHGVVSCSDLIRPDVVALGFGQFEKTFEPDRVLCIFETIEKQVSLVFFHVEGMATLFGVGLPFSKVLLKVDAVEIREVQETVWRDCWKEQTGRQSYPLLFDFTDNNRRLEQATASTSQVSKHGMSTDEAAERLGVGVEGFSEFTELTSEMESVSLKPNEEQPAWVGVIHRLLLEEGASDWHTIMTEYTKNLSSGADRQENSGQSAQAAVSTGYESLEVPQTYLSISDNFLSLLKGFTGFGLASGENSSSETDYQQLRLTVMVYLDPSGYKLYSRLEKTELHFVRESGNIKATVSEAEFELSDYEMVPTVVISFFYDPTVKSSRGKRLLTSLDSRFHMDGSVSDEKLFGWYHDELRLSFRCCEAKAVMREKRQAEQEILSEHERRSFGKERGSEDSTLTLKGRGKEFELAGGHQYFAQVRFKGSSNNALTKGNTTRDQISGQVVTHCLKDANFAIKNVEAGSQELAYQATLFPPISYYSKWDKADRELAVASGMMSSVELEIQGSWIVKGEDDALSQRSRLCPYDFLCQRKLAQHRLVPAPPVKTRKFWKHKEVGKLNLEEILLQQKLSKQFLVNHSFSHMNFQKLQRPEAYEWDIAYNTTSPVEEIIQ